MTRNKTALIVILLLFVFAVVFFMSYAVKNFAAGAQFKAAAAEEKEAVALLADKDYTIYYVGTPSQHLIDSGIKMNVVPEAEMSSETLPVFGYSFDFTEYDEEGNVVNHETAVDYSYYMLIYVDGTVTLDASKVELLRNCAIDNDVPLIIEGKENIKAFRDALLMSEHIYEDTDTMMFTPWNGAEDHVISADALDGGPAFVISLMTEMNDVIGDKDDYVREIRASYVESAAEASVEEASAGTGESVVDDEIEGGEETEPSYTEEVIYDGTFAEGYDEP